MEEKLNEWLNPIWGRNITEEELANWQDYTRSVWYKVDMITLNDDEKSVALRYFIGVQD